MSDIDNAPDSVAPSAPVPGAASPAAATDEAASATATTDESPADTTEEPTGKPGASIQKAINRLTRRAGEAERRAMRAEARAEALEAARSTPQPAPRQSAELKSTDFANYDEFTRAQAAEAARAAVREELKAEREVKANREGQQLAERARAAFEKEATTQAEAAGIDFEDAWETLLALPSSDVSQEVAAYLYQEATHKAAMVDYFAKNVGEIARISGLAPLKQVAELTRLEARLGSKAAPRTTNAPPPGPSVGGRSARNFDPGNASMDEYAAHWKARKANAS